MKGTRSIWFRALHSALTLALAGVLAVGVGQIPTVGAATFSGQITAVEAKTALVTARAIGSGRTFQFKTGDAGSVVWLRPGQLVQANSEGQPQPSPQAPTSGIRGEVAVPGAGASQPPSGALQAELVAQLHAYVGEFWALPEMSVTKKEIKVTDIGLLNADGSHIYVKFSVEIREKLGSAVVYTLGGSAQGNFHLGQVTSDKICIAAPPGSYTALTVTSMDIPRVSGPEADLARRAIAANFPPNVCVPLYPTITLVDVHATEMDCVCLPGKPGPVPGTVRFRVTLSNLSARTVTVHYATADGSAKAGTDYGAISGNLTIPSLSSSIDIRVGLRCRKAMQGDRTFTLTLSSPINGLLARSQAQGVIVDSDDDGSCPGNRPRP